MKTLRLKPGKERSLQRRHPWVFESAIARGGADAGETVRIEETAPISKLKTWKVIERVNTHATPTKSDAAA